MTLRVTNAPLELWWLVLGVSRFSSLAAVRIAYHKLALQHGPGTVRREAIDVAFTIALAGRAP